MAVGKPGIPNVRGMGERQVQGAVDALRQRLEAIEKLLTTTDKIARVASQAGSTTNATLSNLQSQITQLKTQITALTLVASGEVKILKAAGNVALGDAVNGSGLGAGTIDPTDGFGVQAPIGVAISAATAGDDVQVRIFGRMTTLQSGFT